MNQITSLQKIISILEDIISVEILPFFIFTIECQSCLSIIYTEPEVSSAFQSLCASFVPTMEGWVYLAQQSYYDFPIPFSIIDILNPNESIIFANKSFLELTGYDAADLIGKHSRILYTSGNTESTIRHELREVL